MNLLDVPEWCEHAAFHPSAMRTNQTASREFRLTINTHLLLKKHKVCSSCLPVLTSEKTQYIIPVKPVMVNTFYQHRMTAPGISGKFLKRLNNARLQWIDMDIGNQLVKISLLFTDNRLITVLKEMPALL